MLICNEGMVDIKRQVETFMTEEQEVRLNVPHIGGTNSACQS